MAVMSPGKNKKSKTAIGKGKKKASILQSFLRRATKGSMTGDIGAARQKRDEQLKRVMKSMTPKNKRKK